MTYDRTIPTQAEIEALSRELAEEAEWRRGWPDDSGDLLHRAALMIARLELAYLSGLATSSSAGLATKA